MDYKDKIFNCSSESMEELPDESIDLIVTSPPYNVGMEYEQILDISDYLYFIGNVLKESYRVLINGGRIAVNIANTGRKPYIPLSTHYRYWFYDER